MMGMFSVTNHPVVILFDSGASHSFINKTFVVKHEISIGATKENFFIQSLRGRLCTEEMVYQVPVTPNFKDKIECTSYVCQDQLFIHITTS